MISAASSNSWARWTVLGAQWGELPAGCGGRLAVQRRFMLEYVPWFPAAKPGHRASVGMMVSLNVLSFLVPQILEFSNLVPGKRAAALRRKASNLFPAAC